MKGAWRIYGHMAINIYNCLDKGVGQLIPLSPILLLWLVIWWLYDPFWCQFQIWLILYFILNKEIQCCILAFRITWFKGTFKGPIQHLWERLSFQFQNKVKGKLISKLKVITNCGNYQPCLTTGIQCNQFELLLKHRWVICFCAHCINPLAISLPVGVADCALPVSRSQAYSAFSADAVAAAVADCTWVPELSQRPLAACTCPLSVLPGKTLCSFPSKILELISHPPEIEEDGELHTFNCQKCQKR